MITENWYPTWYHCHGSKMRVKNFDAQNHLVISGSAAKITICKAASVYPEAKGWFVVNWEVTQYKPYKEGVHGSSLFNNEEIEAAFGLSESSKLYGGLLIKYEEGVAEEGKFIRYKNFLNIPCPGTGYDGDPNISIYIDEDIRNAVRKLLA